MRRGQPRFLASLDRSTGLFALLAVLTMVPAAFVLWFMNEAVTTQTAAVRRTVMESYRGQLRLVRARVDAHWRSHATRLNATGNPEQQFARLILDATADGLVLLDSAGQVAYPASSQPDTAAARAAHDELDALGRLPPGEARDKAVQRLAALINDYDQPMGGAQRLAIMDRLRALSPNVRIPTEAALRLSTAFARSDRLTVSPGHFSPTAVRDLWAFGSDDGRVSALYWTGRIEAMMHDLLHQVTPAGIRFLAFPPDIESDPEAIAAGSSMPGWELSFHPLDMTPFETAARRQVLVYVTVATAGLAVMAILGIAAARAFRRQLHLARLKTDLVAAVSHELRTPVASMRVLVDGLLADGELDPRKTREYLVMLAAENARLSRLVENFLTFSRLERGGQHFVITPTHPSAIVSTAADAVRDRLPDDQTLTIDVDPDLPPVAADADALATALVNLLDNAIKYTADDKRITLRVRREADAVVFAVGDNGIGIPPRERRKIFRRFYRVDQHLTRQTGGVGLGLSIVELIARAHGGSIDVDSETGRGSTFAIRVPCAATGVAV